MSGRSEAAFALSCYGAYLAVRRAVWTDTGRERARSNAIDLLALERRLGIDIEEAAQRAASDHRRLIRGLNVGYAAGNVFLSVGWLIVLHRRGSPVFRRERRAAAVAFVGALPVFLMRPTAPPRRLDHMTDTLLDSSGIDLEHPLLIRFYNPIAAMPSHHAAFATVTGFGLAAKSRGRIGGWGWRSYPGAVAAAVVATGNHFVLDVVAGVALGGVARWVTR
ncbi:MAG: phosphatase PAP2 family protein [Acidimicrobiales bacterium]